MIAMIALLFGALGVVAQLFGFRWLIGILLLLGVIGGEFSYSLPEVSAISR